MGHLDEHKRILPADGLQTALKAVREDDALSAAATAASRTGHARLGHATAASQDTAPRHLVVRCGRIRGSRPDVVLLTEPS